MHLIHSTTYPIKKHLHRQTSWIILNLISKLTTMWLITFNWKIALLCWCSWYQYSPGGREKEREEGLRMHSTPHPPNTVGGSAHLLHIKHLYLTSHHAPSTMWLGLNTSLTVRTPQLPWISLTSLGVLQPLPRLRLFKIPKMSLSQVQTKENLHSCRLTCWDCCSGCALSFMFKFASLPDLIDISPLNCCVWRQERAWRSNFNSPVIVCLEYNQQNRCLSYFFLCFTWKCSNISTQWFLAFVSCCMLNLSIKN